MVMAGFWNAAEPILPWISLPVVSGGGGEGGVFRKVRGGNERQKGIFLGRFWQKLWRTKS